MSTWPGMRPTTDQYFLGLCRLASSRGTCIRRKVGCVLVDIHRHVLSIGYNGVVRGEVHCIDVPCPGANMPSGEGLSLCQATHGEANALLQCRDLDAVHTAYSTTSPCILCMRMLANLNNLQRIVFEEAYPHVESSKLASRRGIEWVHYRAN